MKTQRKSRIEDLIAFDKERGNLVIGTDEAGRGPIAGPVFAGAVFFPEFNDEIIEAIKFIDDSKRFSSNPRLRKEIADEIKEHALYSVAKCSVEEIERYNILQASLLAMKRACDKIFLQIGKKCNKSGKKIYKSDKKNDKFTILVDGKFTISGYKEKQIAVKKGDSLSASISAASILAKVHRDDFMEKIAQEFPVYEWHNNKGYGTSAHIDAIRTHGHCKWHRIGFLSKIFTNQQKLLF